MPYLKRFFSLYILIGIYITGISTGYTQILAPGSATTAETPVLPSSVSSPPLASAPPNNRDKVDFGPYVKKLQKTIRHNWALMSPNNILDQVKIVAMFNIDRNGNMSDLKIKEASPYKQANQIALAAIQKSAPFDKLPSRFNGKFITVQFIFNYNSLPSPPDQPSSHPRITRMRSLWLKLFEL